jgi:murein DD-endopeptidase MepM/ murein hydrolase activator NlpD
MAVNPITSDDLTIDLRALMSIPVGDRVQAAASDPGFAQVLMQALTPIQIAKAFPDYYRRELPDISNFILANRYLDTGGRFDQRGGGIYGDQKDMYGGEAALDSTARPTGIPQPTVEEMKAKLLEKGIDVQGAFDAIGNGLSADDPRVEFLKNMPAEKLTAMGIETYKDENGNSMLRMKPIEEATMSNEEIIKQSTSKVGARPEGMNTKQSVMYGLQKRGFTKEEAAAVAGNVDAESSFRAGIVNSIGAVGYMQWLGPRKQGLFNYAQSLGKDWSDPEVQLDYIALERSGESVKYSGPNSSEKANYDKAFASGDPIQMAADFGRFVERPSAAELEGSMNTRIRGAQSAYETDITTYTPVLDENSTPQQIEEARKTLIENRKNARLIAGIREVYSQPSPTSSDYQLSGETLINELGYSVPVTGKMLHEGHGATSEFGYGRGRLHRGVDIYSTDPETGQLRVGSNAPVTAPSEGKVTMIMSDRGKAGNYIEIQDKNGYRHRFLHTAKDPAINPSTGEAWKVGDTILQGQTVTHITGSGTKFDQKVSELGGNINAAVQYFDQNGWGSVNKPHLHYEVRDNSGRLINPETIFPEYSGKDKEKITFANKDDKLKHMLVTGQISKEDYEKQKNISEPIVEESKALPLPDTNVEKKQKPLSIIAYSRPEENIVKKETTVPEELPKYQYGGTPDVQDDEDLTAVGSDGKPKFKFNSGEGLYVKPEANEYADDKISELSDRVDRMSETQQTPRQQEMQPTSPTPDPRWVEKVADAYRPAGTQQRAFNRAQFRNEGRHVGDRGSPNIA